MQLCDLRRTSSSPLPALPAASAPNIFEELSFPSRVVIATDAWAPQVNGVQRTLDRTVEEIRAGGREVMVIQPGEFRSLPNPIYPEVPISLPSPRRLSKELRKFEPEAVHISTEGPIGLAMRHLCKRLGWSFTTAFHTMWPDYMKRLVGVPERFTWSAMRWFHGPSEAVLVPSPSMIERLKEQKIGAAKLWSRGIDGTLFHPRERQIPDEMRPVLTYVGRVSHEKNIEAFLRLKLPRELCGKKIVVGDGPALERLRHEYPEVDFQGRKTGESLAQAFSEADAFVFPSLTDTFGNVIIEALACGTPVAAFPVTGPKDIITKQELGSLNEDLTQAIYEALTRGKREECARYAREHFTWERATGQFLSHLAKLRG